MSTNENANAASTKSLSRKSLLVTDIAPPRHHAHDTLRQVPMALWVLTCHYELSDPAVLVGLALCLGTPIPHARFLKEHVTDYADADVLGDSLLNKAEHLLVDPPGSQLITD